MENISKKDICLSLYVGCLLMEAGSDLKTIAKTSDQKIYEILKLLLGQKTKDDFKMDEDSLRLVNEIQLILKISEQTGVMIFDLMKQILKSEMPQGFCQQRSTRSALRIVMLGLRAGLSFPQSIHMYFENLSTSQNDAADVSSPFEKFKTHLNEQNLDDALEIVPLITYNGADLSDYFSFLSGNTQL
jgi:hypothetical protein